MAPLLPLDAYPAFRVSRIAELAGILEGQLAARLVKGPGNYPDGAKGNRFKLPVGELWLCAYGLPTTVRFPDSDYLRVQLQLAGTGTTVIGHETVALSDTQACASAAAATVWFGPEFRQLVWRISKRALADKIEGITGVRVTRDLAFDPALDLQNAQGALVKHLIAVLLNAVEAGQDQPSKIVLAELEQALMVALLGTTAHRSRDLLMRPQAAVAPWQVRRAEEYIAANWDKPIVIEDLVAATGASARTLFRTFRESRGCTPLEFARRVRLDAARRMLDRPGNGSTVTQVAMACGFADLGHFTKSFRRAFGVPPSTFLDRS